MFDIDKYSFSKFEEFESILNVVLNPEELEHVEAKASSIQASIFRRVSKEFLSKLCSVPENLDEKEIERDTQLRRQSKDNTLYRNCTTNDLMLRHKRLKSVFFSCTMLATNHKSTRGNKCCRAFVSDEGYVAVYPIKSQDEFETSLHWFCKEVGIPVDLIVDRFSAEKKLSVKRFYNQVGTTPKIL